MDCHSDGERKKKKRKRERKKKGGGGHLHISEDTATHYQVKFQPLLQIHFKHSGTLLQCQISAPCCHKPDKGNNCVIKDLLTGPMIVACQ